MKYIRTNSRHLMNFTHRGTQTSFNFVAPQRVPSAPGPLSGLSELPLEQHAFYCCMPTSLYHPPRLTFTFVFLSGLYWHLSGLSELPLEPHAFFYYSPASLLPLCRFVLFFVGLFLYPARVCCRQASTATTAQHGAITPAQKQQHNYVLIRARQRNQADRIGESREPACCRESSISTARCVLKTTKSKLCTTYENMQPLTKQLLKLD